MDLREVFCSLSAPSGEDPRTLTAIRIPGFPAVRLGRTTFGDPALVIATEEDQTVREPPIQLTHLSVEHDVFCRIDGEEGKIEAKFSVVRLMGGDTALAEYFLDILPAVIRTIGGKPTIRTVNEALAGLVELFRALSEPPSTTVQGLWAELFVLSQARDAAVLARAWHSTPEERFDFSSGEHRLEIKSSLGRRRAHHFSFEQLRGSAGARILVGSVLMEHAAGGLTLGGVLARVREALDGLPDLAVRLDRVVAMCLGTDLPQALEVSFDEHLAADSLEWFWAEAIPSIEPPLPVRVSKVHFVADLEGLPAVPDGELRPHGGLFGAI